jgi:hypothetical protein
MTKKLEKFQVRVLITAVIAGFLIVVANSAIWANRYLSDTDNFTQTAVTAITSDSSTDAIASEIVDKALADYPAVKNVVDDAATNFISGLLGSARMQKALTQVVSRLQIFLTTPQKQPVVINLEGAKTTVNQLIQLSGREGQTNFDPNKIPDQITVFDPAKYPNFYHYTVILTWLSPLAALGAVALLAWPYVAQRAKYRQVMLIQGACVTLAGLLALLVGPLFRPVVLANVSSINMRVLVTNLYDAFMATFNQQTYWVIGMGVLAAAVSVGISAYLHYRPTPVKK